MHTFSLSQAGEIQEYQFLTDSSGIILNSKGELYSFQGSSLKQINTPSDLKITNFHFINQTHGAIIGEKGLIEKNIQKGSFVGDGAIILPIFICLLFARKLLKYTLIRNTILNLLFFIVCGSLLLACSQKWQQYRYSDPQSSVVTYITSNQLHRASFHTYFSNKGLSTYCAKTEDAGDKWNVDTVPTNFHLSALTAVGGNYLIGTFANENSSKEIPYHGDGDLYIIGNDSSYNKIFNKNKTISWYKIYINRGIKGFVHSADDSTLYIFGSETEPVFSISIGGNNDKEVNKTLGNIWVMSKSLKPSYKIIDAPGKEMVLSLSPSSKKIWVTMDDKIEEVDKPFRNKKILCFRDNKWDEIKIANLESAKQVEFVNSTNTGYVIDDKNGSLFKTTDGGANWAFTYINGIIKMHSFNNKITLLTKNSELKIFE